MGKVNRDANVPKNGRVAFGVVQGLEATGTPTFEPQAAGGQAGNFC
jgi:hypothetical protein